MDIFKLSESPGDLSLSQLVESYNDLVIVYKKALERVADLEYKLLSRNAELATIDGDSDLDKYQRLCKSHKELMDRVARYLKLMVSRHIPLSVIASCDSENADRDFAKRETERARKREWARAQYAKRVNRPFVPESESGSCVLMTGREVAKKKRREKYLQLKEKKKSQANKLK